MHRRLPRRALAASVLGAALGGLPACGRVAPPAAEVAAATPAAVPLPVLATDEVRALLAQLRGRPVLVNLWATWCLPCVEELPVLDALARDYAPRGLEVVAVSLDDPRARERAVLPFLAARRPRFRVVLHAGEVGRLRELLDPGWDGAIPASFLLDRDGRLAERLAGAQKREAFERALAPLVGSPPPRGEGRTAAAPAPAAGASPGRAR